MEDYVVFLLIAGGALLLVFIYIAIAGEVRRKKKLRDLVASSYGKTPERTYTEEEREKIASMYRIGSDARYTVDDITFHDLDIDSVYRTVNACFSSSGDERLYEMLRTPEFSPDTLLRRDVTARFFDEHEDVRTALMTAFAKIGRTKKQSIARFLSDFTLPDVRPFSEIIYIILLLLAGGAFFIHVGAGIGAVIAVMIFNIAMYFRTKSKVESHYAAVSAVAYLESGALELSKFDVPELSYLLDPIRKEAEKAKILKKGMKWLGASGRGIVSLGILDVLMDYVRMVTHVDFLVFYRMAKRIDENRSGLMSLHRNMGELEALISIASYRKTLPYYAVPEFTGQDGRTVTLTEAYHPLLRSPVPNSIEIGKPVLLTGSNASGKSTFLRTAALSVILGETIATVPAKRLKTPFFRVFTSMALQDDLKGGESYFTVEIKSIKRILDAYDGEPRIMTCIDEVLRGTNTVERVAASAQLLNDFEKRGITVLAATHDIELTRLLSETFDQYHFAEHVDGNAVTFDYQLKKGPAESRNAIRLLGLMGYDRSVVKGAEETAERFLKEGTWTLC